MFDAIPENPVTTAATFKQRLAEAFLQAPPSGKIRMAIADLEAAERSAKYEIDMDTWHTAARAETEGRCRVCLAGSVMANRHDILPSQTYVGGFEPDGPDEYGAPEKWEAIFEGLDEFRSGYVTEFLHSEGSMPDTAIREFEQAHGPSEEFDAYPSHVEYEDDARAFKRWSLAIADKLEAVGY